MVNKKGVKKILFYGIILLIFLSIIVLVNRNIVFDSIKTSAEYLRAKTYAELTKEDEKVENCEYIKFSAFFTRDLNGDGYAEKLLGTCKDISEKDVLYMDINVLTNGYLKDGRITINGSNFNYSMEMVKDSVLKNSYISSDVRTIELNKINAGTQKLILGDIVPDLSNNINNYSNISSITLTGTHVSDDDIETKIEKTIDLTIDWYGDVKTNLKIDKSKVTYYYDNLESETISFTFRADEVLEELLLKENVSTVYIPKLCNYSPTEVKCTTSKIESNYDEKTQLLTIKRKSIIDDNGKLTTSLSRANTYTIEVTYPIEAFEQISTYTTIQYPITSYYVGYNNQNEEFENLVMSNIATSKVTAVFEETGDPGFIYRFDVSLANKARVSIPERRYIISKQNLLNAYNTEEETSIGYTVNWYATRGIKGEVDLMIMSETKNSSIYGDAFDKTIIQEYTTNTGIYFSGADSMLGDSGTISVYDDVSNELIKTFTKEDWNKYNAKNPYVYEVPVKHIRIETSKANLETTLVVSNIKNFDVQKIKQDFTKQQIEDVEIIFTYLTGKVKLSDGQYSGVNDVDFAYYVSEKSNVSISLSDSKLDTQKTKFNQEIYIRTLENQLDSSKWQNGEFLVEMPKEIINMEINEVITDNENVKIVAYDLYQKDGKYFLKILTSNDEPVIYQIKVICSMTPNPSVASIEKAVNLYAYNECCNEYYYETKDIYDANSNNYFSDNVGKATTKMELLSPTELITLESVSKFNEAGDEVFAPNIAGIEKDVKQATINIRLMNNYANMISKVEILGKIPFEGNTYVLNNKSLNSNFTTTMTDKGIVVPNELKNLVKVYYSENENPTRDLDDESNGWLLAESVKDFSKIKTYLIDMKKHTLSANEECEFSYVVNIPEGIDYNLVSYSNHAVFYELATDGGNLQLSTEPNKVGLSVVRKFDLEIIKNKFGFENKKVAAATYMVERFDQVGNKITRLLTTNSDGIINLADLFVGFEYTVKEVKSPENYCLNNEVLTFSINETNGELVLDSKFDNIVLEDEKVVMKVEDEPKYNFAITKINQETGDALKGIYFMFNGLLKSTTVDGEILLEKLELNKEYTLSEIQNYEYYLIDEIKFKLVRDTNGELKLESKCENFKNVVITNTEAEELITVEIELTNEKIPTYDLQILKVEENFDEENIENLKPLANAKFTLTSKDTNFIQECTTNENGMIEVQDLYMFVEGKNLTANYTLQEIQAPTGFANNAEEIKFRVSKNSEDELQMEIQDQEDLETVRNIIVDGNTVKLVIQDKPLFKVIKTDSETGAPLANVGFTIYEIDEEGKIIDFAKDVNNNYVGVLNEDDAYVIRTNESGIITVPLRSGTYRMVEVEFPEGYEENVADEFFVIDDGSEEQKEDDNEESEDTENVLEINYIEDLVDLSNAVNAGNTYSGTTIKLMRTLDFEDDNSYENPGDTSYGDYNGNGSVQGIKDELIDESGLGFKPIGNNYNYYFSGTFEGQGFEIKNIYINGTQSNYVSFFGNGKNCTIRNIGFVDGQISSNSQFVSGLCGDLENSYIFNCYNSNLLYGSNRIGGIIGQSSNSVIKNCYNRGRISGYHYGLIAGGIVASDTNSTISNCINYGNIVSDGIDSAPTYGNIGGIVGHVSGSNINSCYNYGNIEVNSISTFNWHTYIGGIVGSQDATGEIDTTFNRGNIIFNCKDSSYGGFVGGIIGSAEDGGNLKNSCNFGKVGGYNVITYSFGKCVGGLVGNANNYNINNCYNNGDIYNTVEDGNYRNAYSGPIIGRGDNNILTNVFYSENVVVTGNTIKSDGTKISEEYMKSEEFYKALNSDNVWINVRNTFPTLPVIPINATSITEIDIENESKKFNILTQILLNSENACIGGSVNESTAMTNEIESVKYNKNSTKNIIITPDNDYYISEIFINNEKVEFKVNEDKSVIFSEGYFSNVKEDKIISVKFEPKENFIITKVDSDNTELKLEGAKFKIETAVTSLSTSEIIGEIKSNSAYIFTGTSSYRSNNDGMPNTVATSYFPIDLRNYSGTVTLKLYVTISSQPNYDIGYATITESTTIPAYNNSTGRFIYTSGSSSYTGYSTTLNCGKLYYLHVGYRKNGSIDSYDDYFKINSMSLYTTSDTAVVEEYITDENGQISLRKPNDRNIKITEIRAPLGYNLASQVKEVQIADTEILELTYTNEKKTSNATITKIDKTTNKPLPNVTFDIYNINSTEKICTKTTDENGQIKMWLPDGYYKAVEVSAPEGYVLEDERVSYFKTEGYDETELTPTLEIDSIEDLVRFSNNVNSGTTYSGLLVTLNKTLDFNDDASYENPDDTTTFGDYNEDGTTESIKIELTKTAAGCGFKPIGRSNSFRGIFDGNGYEIKNIYIKNTGYTYTGLFGNVPNAIIRNLGVTGVINNTRNNSIYTGGIAGYTSNTKIINCYNMAKINISSNSFIYTGGIVGALNNNSIIEGSYNLGIINVENTSTGSRKTYVGGIVGNIYNSKVETCYNTQNINVTSMGNGYIMVAGIVGYIEIGEIRNCYNIGNLICSNKGYGYVGGVVGQQASSVIKIVNVYNTGNISLQGSYTNYMGGIAGYLQNNGLISNAYNKGNLIKTGTNYIHAGGISGYAYNAKSIKNVYNIGDVASASTTNITKGAIVGYLYNTILDNVYYSNSINTFGSGSGTNGIKLSNLEELKSENMLKLLNNDKAGVNWISDENGYPTLDFDNVKNMFMNSVSEITIDNSRSVYKLTTKLEKNSEGQQVGGTISGQNQVVYEVVEYNESSSKNIVINPDDGYEIEYITINGNLVDFELDSEGNVLLDKFIQMKEDKEVIVKFIKVSEYNFVLTKKDKVTNEPMLGVKFSILDENGEFAKDYVGNTVGTLEEIDGEEKYVVTTDSNGEIRLKLNMGKYKIVEVKTLEGYILDVEKEVEITSENVEYELSANVTPISTHYPWKEYILPTSDGGIIQTCNGMETTIPVANTVNNQEIQLVSGKGYIVKYNKNGKIEHLIQPNGYLDGVAVYEDSDGNYLALGVGGSATIPASDTVNNEEINLTYSSTGTIILKLNKEFKIIWASTIDAIYPSTTYCGWFKENNAGNYFINFGRSGNATSVTIPAEDTVNNEEVSITIDTSKYNILAEYNKSGKFVNMYQIAMNFQSLLEKENGGYLATNYGGVCEYDSSFNIVRQLTYNFTGISIANSYVTDDEGFIMGAALMSNATISEEYTVTGEPIELATETPDSLLIKYNKDFKIEWAKTNSLDDNGISECNVYIKQTKAGDYVAIVNVSTNPGTYKLVKYDSLGNLQTRIEIDSNVNTYNYLYTNNDVTQCIMSVYSESNYNLMSYKFGNNDFVPLELTITNQKAAKVIVHHYLEETGPEFGNEPVILAEDEVILGKEGDEFTTSPNMKIPEYTLLKDINGEYVIPENASGTFNLENQEIFYYYNKAPLEVVVHHYLDGTETKLLDDEHYYYQEGESYKVEASEEILLTHNFVEVIGDVEKVITENEEISFYYRIKEYDINTEVEILLNSDIKGGDISGEAMAPFEIVEHGSDSKEDILITPYDGYKVSIIKLQSTDENGNVSESVIYGENAVENTEITYKKNLDGSILLTKFANMAADKKVLVSFEPDVGRVIVHHYIENSAEKIYDDILIIDTVGNVVETKPVKVENYVVVKAPESAEVTITEQTQEKVYYYQRQYEVTTGIKQYQELDENGEWQDIIGGTIVIEGDIEKEEILRNRNSQKTITITPYKDFEIVEITVNGVPQDFEEFIQEDGSVVFAKEFFRKVDEDKFVEVEFRRKSQVLVKFMEFGTNKVLAEEILISGYVGKEFETTRLNIPGYKATDFGITDQVGDIIESHGFMQLEDITVIYWYEKAEDGILVKHIDKVLNKTLNEEGLEEITLTENILKEEHIEGLAGEEKETLRKEFENYVSSENLDAINGVNVGKDENNKTVTVLENGLVEVIYWYEKEFKITTDVIEHEETDENGTIITVKGGSILGEDEEPYETVLRASDTTKEIKIVPDDGYRIEKVLVNDKEIFVQEKLEIDGSLLLSKFSNVQENKHIEVEFEVIPSTVVVKYVDKYTKECIAEDKVIHGVLGAEYVVTRLEIGSYIPADPEPENIAGKMTEDPITVIFWYTKQFKITTDVNEVEGVKGGEISGEDEAPYEIVSREGTSTKQIIIKPEAGYRIKELTINDIPIEIKDLIKLDKSLELPMFEDIQEDKHIVVEFEKIPAKVIVKFLEQGSEKVLSEQVVIEGFVNQEYETKSIEIADYELVEKLPTNSKGTMTEEDIIVIYYYKKIEKVVEQPEVQEPEKPQEKPQEKPTEPTPEQNQPPVTWEPNIPNYQINTNNKPNKVENVKTGDNILGFVLILIVSSIGLIILKLNKKK